SSCEGLCNVSPLAPLVRSRKIPMLERLVLRDEVPALYVRSPKVGINPAHTQFGGHIRFKGSGQIEPRSVYGRLRGLDKVEREIACQIIHEESRTHGRIKRRVRASEHQAVAAEGAIGETQARSPIVAAREDQS